MTDGHTERLEAALAGRYRVERKLGEGGMASVYLAEDLKHKRRVALKILKPELAAVIGAERFLTEIQTTANLQHPHILPLFDSGSADGYLYYVMPYIDGETLRDKLDREKQLGVEESVRIARDVADALDYAHRHGVIHRDIKPGNILLHDGRPVVADRPQLLRGVEGEVGGAMTDITRREALTLLGASAVTLLAPGSMRAMTQVGGRVVRTVLADLLPSALRGGTTLFHEHLSHSPDWNARMAARPSQAGAAPFVPRRDPIVGCALDAWDGCDNLDFMVEELVRAKRDGVLCIVDGSQADRNVAFLTEMSRRSGVSIVASGGYYLDEMYPPELRTLSESQIAQLLIGDATAHAIGAFGEIGSSHEITATERKVFRAVGIAHRATDLPIFTHTDNGAAAEEQLDILESAGVAPGRVAIGHLGSVASPDVTVHRAICARGAYVGFDRQGGRRDEMNVGMVLELIEAGFADNILISADFGVNQWPNWQQNGGPGVSRALTVFVPLLRRAGVPEETLIGILEDNPLRFLACSPRVPRAA